MKDWKVGLARAGVAVGMLLASLAPSPARADIVDLSGHVTVNLTGAPVAGARVSITAAEALGPPVEVGSATTDAGGFYLWIGVCSSAFGNCGIAVDVPPYLPASALFADDVPVQVIDLALLTPARVTGTVRFAGQSPAGIDVTAEMYVEDVGLWSQVSDGVAAEDGSYAVENLPPGTYRICTGYDSHGAVRQCFDHADMPPTATDPDATPIDVAEGSEHDGIDFDLTLGGVLSGTIYDGYLGAPLANEPVAMTLYDVDGNWLMAGAADASGAYRLDGVPDGTFYLGVSAGSVFADGIQWYPGVVCTVDDCPPPTSGQALTILGANEIDGLDFTVHPQVVVEGRVFDPASGSGLGGIEVGVYSGGIRGPVFAHTDDTGAYRFYWNADDPISVGAFNASPRVDSVYPGASCIGSHCVGTSTPVSGALGSVLTGIDIPMLLGAALSGTISRVDNGLPGTATIELYDSSFTPIWTGELLEGGYVTDAWLPGTFYVEGTGAYPLTGCFFFDDSPCPGDGDPRGASPTPIDVAAGEIRTGVDFRFPAVDPIFAEGFEF